MAAESLPAQQTSNIRILAGKKQEKAARHLDFAACLKQTLFWSQPTGQSDP